MSQDLHGVAIIFDLDGTLVDTAGDLAAAMNYALAANGFQSAPAESVRNLVGRGARRMYERGFQIAAERRPTDEELSTGLSLLLRHYEQNIAVQSRLYPGAKTLIEELRRRGAAIAVCTNKREALSRLLLAALKVDHLFDALVGADTADAPKPDSAPVKLCLQECRAKKGVFVGDSDTDVKAASSMDLPCLIARFGYGPVTMTADIFAVFDHYREAHDLIDQALNR